MTREQYYEMCEALGTTPDENQVPIEFSDLATEVQQCVWLYNSLKDVWDYFGGNYVGKDLTHFWSLFQLYNLDPRDGRWYWDMVTHIDNIRSRQIAQDQKNKQKPAK